MYKAENEYDILVIEAYLKCNNLSKSQFCKICKISIDILDKIFANDKNVLVSDLEKIAYELKIPIASLFKCEYYAKIQTRFIL